MEPQGEFGLRPGWKIVWRKSGRLHDGFIESVNRDARGLAIRVRGGAIVREYQVLSVVLPPNEHDPTFDVEDYIRECERKATVAWR